jgi:hypothetical protein
MAFDDHFEAEFGEDSESVSVQVRSVAAATPYAALGFVAEGLRRGSDALAYAAATPIRLARATTAAPRSFVRAVGSVPERVGGAFRQSEQVGRNTVDRILGRKATVQAQRQIHAARSKAKSVTTSAIKAARASANAVAAATQAAVDPRDTRPYEDRTRGELYDLAGERDITGRSEMSKKQLIKALRRDR